MPHTSFRLSPWTPDNTVWLEAWGHDRRDVLQAGLDAVLTLMLGEDVRRPQANGPVVPLRGEGDTVESLFSDLLDDLFEQIEVHGPVQVAALDGVLKRDHDGFVAWGYLTPQENLAPLPVFERAGDVEAVVATPEEIRLRVTLRRLA